MRTRTGQITLTVICLLVGIMLVTQFRTQTRIQRSVLTESAANQAMIVSNLYDGNVALRKEVEELTRQLEQYARASDQMDVVAMGNELNRMLVVTGASEVTGPGVELNIEAALSREDLLDLINELRNTGAEALAVNEERIVAQAAVAGEHGALTINGLSIAMPYVLRAIGHPETVERALVRKGGVLSIIESAHPDARFTVTRHDELTLPAYRGDYKRSYAKPADK